MKLFIISLLCLVASVSVYGQPKSATPKPTAPKNTPAPAPPMKAGRTVGNEASAASYKDSAEFVKAFKEFYPLVAPEKTVRAEAESYLMRISKSFKMQGIDSAKAIAVALNNIDDDAFYNTYFNTYRKYLSAKELRKYAEFLKTPEGKKVVMYLPQLQRTPAEATSYVSRTINTNLTPIRQEAQEKRMKENPPKSGGSVPQLRRDSTGHIIPPQRMPAQSIEPPPPMSADSTQKR